MKTFKTITDVEQFRSHPVWSKYSCGFPMVIF